MKKAVHLFLCISLLILCGFCTKQNKVTQPNIILLTVDALRADHMGCYGYEYNTSPNIDSFAEKSTLFEFAYCTIPKTSASFASMMTGLHPLVHKTNPNRDALKPRFITLAEALRMRGYFNFGVVDNGNLSKKYHFNQGFHEYIEVWNHTESIKESSEFITKKVLDFLDENIKSPFFLWAHYLETHTPYIPPSDFIEERPKGRDINKLAKKIFVGSRNERQLLKKNSDEGYFISLYDGCVKYADSEIGKIIDFIFTRGYDKNSIVIISSDHGEDLGEYNFYFDHGPLAFNAGARVPLIIYFPDKKSKVIRYPVSLMDIYPALLKITGLVPAYKIQGRNLLEKSKDRHIKIMAVSKDFKSFSVVFNNYHFVRVPPRMAEKLGLKTEYLFDLNEDPYERNSILTKKIKLAQYMENENWQFFNKHARNKKDETENPKLSEKDIKNLKTLGYIK